ncbi:hypothetical protein L1887_03512 [Cichorium endivia]|nr:hypothetical protein L1887_03512 [Cichorium endivia]
MLLSSIFFLFVSGITLYVTPHLLSCLQVESHRALRFKFTSHVLQFCFSLSSVSDSTHHQHPSFSATATATTTAATFLPVSLTPTLP